MAISVPLWSILAGQSAITIGLFIFIITTFTLDMKSSIEDQVVLRIQERLQTVRLTLLEPFLEGYNAVALLSTLTSADPSRYMPTDNKSPVDDYEFFHYCGAATNNSKSITFIAQLYESKNAPLAPNGFPTITAEISSQTSEFKGYNSSTYTMFDHAWKVNHSVYAAQDLIYQGPDTSAVSLGPRMNNSANRNYWLNFPSTYTFDSKQKIFNVTTGLDEIISVPTTVFSKLAMLTTAVGETGTGLQYYNNWVYITSVSMNTMEPLLLSLTDFAKGEPDSYAALYDFGVDGSDAKIIAVSHPNAISVVDVASMTYVPATQSSSRRLNVWYSDALVLSRQSGGEQGATHTSDGRFLSFAHISHDSSNLHLFAIVSTSDYMYFSELRTMQATMIAVGVCSGTLVVGLGALIIFFVTMPIRRLKVGMRLAAALQNEKVVPGRSFLTEINSLCNAFAKMNAMLTEAKAFMPASMLVRFSSDDESNGEEEDEAGFENNAASSLRRSAHSGSTRSSQCVSRSAEDQTITEQTTTNDRQVVPDHALSQSALRSKRVSLLVVNVRGFTSLADFSITTIAGHSTTLLDLISAAATTERGVIDSFHGDHFVISFNAIKTVGSPGRKAVQCASAINQVLNRTPYRRVTMGVSCGVAVVGPLGNQTQRRLSIIGGCYTKALRLQKAAVNLENSLAPLFDGNSDAPKHAKKGKISKLDNFFHCLVDALTQVECSEYCHTAFVGMLKDSTGGSDNRKHSPRGAAASVSRSRDTSPDRSKGGQLPSGGISLAQKQSDQQQQLTSAQFNAQVFAVVFNEAIHAGSTKAEECDEWMYEMQQKSLKNPFRLVNEAMDGAVRGYPSVALKAANDKIALLKLEHSSDSAAIELSHSILDLVVGVLEMSGNCSQVTDNSRFNVRKTRFVCPEDLRIDFSALLPEAGAIISKLCSRGDELKRISTVLILDDPSASTTSNRNFGAELLGVQDLTKVEVAELVQWLRIAYLSSLVKEGSDDDFAHSVMYY